MNGNEQWNKDNPIAKETLTCSLIGTTNANHQEIIQQMHIGSAVLLLPDPENPYDARAIRVEYNQQTIGYLPTAEAHKISTRLANSNLDMLGGVVNSIHLVNEQTGDVGVSIRLSLPAAVTPMQPRAVSATPTASLSSQSGTVARKSTVNQNLLLIAVVIIAGIIVIGLFILLIQASNPQMTSNFFATNTPTNTVTSTLTPSPSPTRTRWPTNPQQPTLTKTPKPFSTQTDEERVSSPWSTIHKSNVGTYQCVTGYVSRTKSDPATNNFYIYFSNQPEDFFFMIINTPYQPNVIGKCIKACGTVQILKDAPFIITYPGFMDCSP